MIWSGSSVSANLSLSSLLSLLLWANRKPLSTDCERPEVPVDLQFWQTEDKNRELCLEGSAISSEVKSNSEGDHTETSPACAEAKEQKVPTPGPERPPRHPVLMRKLFHWFE